MRVGLLARSEDRGIGIQTLGFFRHMRPDVTVVVEMGELARGFTAHVGRYPGAILGRWRRGAFVQNRLQILEAFLSCDVVFAVETFYDWPMVETLTANGVAVVIQGNPEFHEHAVDASVPRPTEFWWPTPWLVGESCFGPVVPVPVEERLPAAADPDDSGPLVVHHIVGHAAIGDRNGTQALVSAIRIVRRPMHFRIFTQDESVANIRSMPRGVTVEVIPGGVEDRWSMYEGAHVVVQPRRYGGLHLPAQEAMAVGCAVVMTDCEPNGFWPTITTAGVRGPDMRTKGGRIPIWNPHPTILARTLDRLATDRGEVELAQHLSRQWAKAHSWPSLRTTYLDHLAKSQVMAT